MKKLIVTCALLTSVSMGAFAQAQNAPATAPAPHASSTQPKNMPTPEQMAERRSKMYQQQYGLNEEQYKGVYAAELDFMQKEQGFRASGVQPGQGQQMQLMMAKDQKFKQAMTPEQYSKYEASRPKMGPNGTAPAPPAGQKN